MPKSRSEKPQPELGLDPNVLSVLTGLRIAVRTAAVPEWIEALKHGPEVVEVGVSSIGFDVDGNPNSVEIRYVDIWRTISDHDGDKSGPFARKMAINPYGTIEYSPNGQNVTFPEYLRILAGEYKGDQLPLTESQDLSSTSIDT